MIVGRVFHGSVTTRRFCWNNLERLHIKWIPPAGTSGRRSVLMTGWPLSTLFFFPFSLLFSSPAYSTGL